MTSDLRLIVVDRNPIVCKAFEQSFEGLAGAEVMNRSFETVEEFDCMVSPANSFGLMDGGIDLAIIQYFGDQLEARVRQYILTHYLGEQPTGSSFIIETGHPKHKYLAHAPTMRIPMEIAHTDNVYRAMWSMLLAVRSHNATHDNDIRTIVCPGLGTGTGKVPALEAAYQMALAYRHYLNPPKHLDWDVATSRQTAIRYGGDHGARIPPKSS